MLEFLLQSANPSSSLRFSRKAPDYFDVAIETPSLTATRKINIYTYRPSDGFCEFFQHLASHGQPWTGEEVWQSLEGDMKLSATCDALDHVALKINFGSSFEDHDSWSLECVLFFDFGVLQDHAAGAMTFMLQ